MGMAVSCSPNFSSKPCWTLFIFFCKASYDLEGELMADVDEVRMMAEHREQADKPRAGLPCGVEQTR